MTINNSVDKPYEESVRFFRLQQKADIFDKGKGEQIGKELCPTVSFLATKLMMLAVIRFSTECAMSYSRLCDVQ